LPDRLALIIEGLCQALAARGAKDRLAPPLILLAWTRLRRLSARFCQAGGCGRAGRLAAPAAHRRADPPAALPPLAPERWPTPPGVPHVPDRLPCGFSWLIRLAPEAEVHGSRVQHWLDDPKLTALLKEAPQAGRILRPLCRMLGIRPGPALCVARCEKPDQPSPPPLPAPLRSPRVSAGCLVPAA
jgi:hypothetical protein